MYYITSEKIFYKPDEPFRSYKTGHEQKPDREHKHNINPLNTELKPICQ